MKTKIRSLGLRRYILIGIGSSLIAFGVFVAVAVALSHVAFTLRVAVWALGMALVVVGWELVRQATRSMVEALGWIIFMILLP